MDRLCATTTATNNDAPGQHRQSKCIVYNVRVITVPKHPPKPPIQFFYGPIRSFVLKTECRFSPKRARGWVTNLELPVSLHTTKWHHVLTTEALVKWGNIWHTQRNKKESAFIWSIWHKAIAVNDWRGKYALNINNTCVFCLGVVETILHCFWECPRVQRTWAWCLDIIHALQQKQNRQPTRSTLTWAHCVFARRLPRHFGTFNVIWTLLRGLTLWEIWLERNDRVFNNNARPIDYLLNRIWQGLLNCVGQRPRNNTSKRTQTYIQKFRL